MIQADRNPSAPRQTAPKTRESPGVDVPSLDGDIWEICKKTEVFQKALTWDRSELTSFNDFSALIESKFDAFSDVVHSGKL